MWMELEELVAIQSVSMEQGMVITPGAHYIPNELYNEMIRLNYYGTPDFSGSQDSIRGV